MREAALVSATLNHTCINVRFNGLEFEILDVDEKAWQVTNRRSLYTVGIKWYRSIKHLLPEIVHKGILKLITYFERLSHRHLKRSEFTLNWILARHKEQQKDKNEKVSSILLLLDSTWDMRVWRQVELFKAKGGYVSAVLYDLIPFTHPETVEKHTGFAHTTWWLAAPLYLDSVMCISQTVRRQFLAWQKSNYLGRCVPEANVNYFHLGSDLTVVKSAATTNLSTNPKYGSYFLVVGSIEPRKNHKTILDAFEILWRDEWPVNLVIVGSHGWMSEAFLDRVAKHPLCGKRLFLLRRTSDEELSNLYEDTLGLVIASIAEGFGLPIVEAFKYGTRVICSDIDVFREVAGDFAVYFAVDDPDELARAVREMYNTPRGQVIRTLPVTAALSSWRESAGSLLKKLDQIHHT